MALGWQAPHRPALYHLYQLSATDTRRSAVIHSGLPENQSAPSGPRGDVRLAARQNQSVASGAVAGAANRAGPVWLFPHSPVGDFPALGHPATPLRILWKKSTYLERVF